VKDGLVDCGSASLCRSHAREKGRCPPRKH
jgi:hypothetical protein